MVLDLFSKYGWIVPLEDKKGETITEAFKTIFKEGRKPQYLWTDKGKEYYNKNIKELLETIDITLYSTENEEKSSVCERWNHTIKSKCGSSDWVFTTALPSIRKYGQYKLFDSPWNKMIMIGNETDLHYKVVDLTRRYYPDTILVAGLGENQDTEDKRLDSYKKGYMRGQPDLLVLDYHKDYKGLGIEFKSPTGNYCVSEAQKEMKKKYVNNGYAFILSNDYDKISKNIHKYTKSIRVPCKYCIKQFLNKDTLKMYYKVIHRIEK